MNRNALLFVSLLFPLGGCAPKIPVVQGTGHYRVDVPTTNWQVGEVVAIYIGRRTPYSISSIYDPRISTVKISESPVTIRTRVQRELEASLGATTNQRIRAEVGAVGSTYYSVVVNLSNARTAQVPRTEIISALRDGGLRPGSVECEYLGDLRDQGVVVDVLEGLLIADLEVELVDRSGAKIQIDAAAMALLEGSLGASFERTSETSMTGRGLIIGYKKDATLLQTAVRACGQ